jgi:hypothetical protein
MPDNTPEIHEVDKTVVKVGEVQVLTKAAFNNPAPKSLQIVLTVIKKFTVYMGGVMSTTTIFNVSQTKIILFVSVMIYGLCDIIQGAVGVVNPNDLNKP